MKALQHEPIIIDSKIFEVIKPTRLMNGMVLRSGNVYARVGDKQPTIEEQVHTVSLLNRGFPVPKVLSSGELPNNKWYFTETSLGTETFHNQFHTEYQSNGKVSDQTFQKYFEVITKYANAQSVPSNKTNISPDEFISTLIPLQDVVRNYSYFGHSVDDYLKSLQIVSQKLGNASMGVIQHDLNPFNMLDGGVIDFELVGYGPIGFDTSMCARWSTGWFTDYPSKYPVAYKLSEDQIKACDELIDDFAVKNGSPAPSQYMQEFLLLKSAWAVSDLDGPQSNWPPDKIAFRKFRANVLNSAVNSYLKAELINFSQFSLIPGGELTS